MSEESKLKDPKSASAAAEGTIAESSRPAQVDSESEDEHDEPPPSTEAPGSSAPAKKKRSKRKKIKAALTGGSKDGKPAEGELSKAIGKLDREQLSALLASNPALARDLGFEGPNTTAESSAQAMEQLKKLSLQDIMTGLASGGKNAKDMASYKFWQTQPVPKFGEKPEEKEEGPIKIIDKEKVSKEPSPLMEGFEWVTMDLTNDEELEEVFQLLNGHYVEDTEAMFRFNYSKAFLQW
jgi:glycylpeptide N-tetradecanoyltransferase